MSEHGDTETSIGPDDNDGCTKMPCIVMEGYDAIQKYLTQTGTSDVLVRPSKASEQTIDIRRQFVIL